MVGGGSYSGAVTIDHNVVTGSAVPGIVFEAGSGATVSSVVERNDIAAATVGITWPDPGTVDGTCNWWGSAGGPSVSQVSGTVNFTPWLVSSSLVGPCTGSAAKPLVGFVLATPSTGSTGTVVTLTSSATDPSGLTDTYYNLFTPSGTFVCNLAHVSIPGAPTSYSDPGTVVAQPMPFAGLDTGVGGPCPAGGIAAGSYVLTANYIDLVGNQVGSPNNQDLTNYPASAQFSPVTYLEPSASISLSKTANPTTFTAVGDVITYTYIVKNAGNVSLSGSVTVSDDHIGSPLGKPFSCGSGPLAPTATITCTATYRITWTDAKLGFVTNKATAKVGTAISNQATATVAAQRRSLALTKSATPTTYNAVGDTIAYTYIVKNTGNVGLPGPVTVSDNKAPVTCPAVTTVGNLDATLNPGESVTCAATYTINAGDLHAGWVTNKATAKASGTTSNLATATVAAQRRSLSLIKSPSPSTFTRAGDRVTYTYVVKNTGNVSLPGPVTVSDNKTPVTCRDVATVGNHDASLDPGETITCAATYTITTADARAGSVTNKATATAGTTTSNQATATVKAKSHH